MVVTIVRPKMDGPIKAMPVLAASGGIPRLAGNHRAAISSLIALQYCTTALVRYVLTKLRKWAS